MAAGTHDILIEQGATFSIILCLKDENYNPLDLTDLSFKGHIKKSFADDPIEAVFEFIKLDQTQEDTKGKVKVFMSATMTREIYTNATGTKRVLTPMVYDIESQDNEGIVVRWLQGTASISPEVTK